MHVYLDMDGVQADFCEHWSKYYNQEFKHIIGQTEIKRLTESNPEEVYHFFRNLPPMRGGMRLVYWLKANKIPFTILSAPLIGDYTASSIRAKIGWLDEHNPGTSKTAIFERKKYLFATTDGEPNILIDDYDKNIREWKDAGGISIMYEDEHKVPGSYRKVIKELKRVLAY